MKTFWFCLVGLLIVIVLGCGKEEQKPVKIEFSDPEKAVSEARQLIEAKKKTPDLYPGGIDPDDLPESLRLSGLKSAVVYEDHLSLLFQKHSDWCSGARIWSATPKTKHTDIKTKYPEIFLFSYSDDFPVAPDNIK